MKYSLVYTQRAVKDTQGLEEKIKKRIAKTLLRVSLIVDNIAAGVPDKEILAAYPSLTKEDIRAALAYAAELTHDRYIPLTSNLRDEIQA